MTRLTRIRPVRPWSPVSGTVTWTFEVTNLRVPYTIRSRERLAADRASVVDFRLNPGRRAAGRNNGSQGEYDSPRGCGTLGNRHRRGSRFGAASPLSLPVPFTGILAGFTKE